MKLTKIKSIKKISRKDRYDLTVPKNSNFFANGVLIHNTSGRTGYAPIPMVSAPTLLQRLRKAGLVLLGRL